MVGAILKRTDCNSHRPLTTLLFPIHFPLRGGSYVSPSPTPPSVCETFISSNFNS